MKHIKKRFQFERFLTEEEKERLKSKSIEFDKHEGQKIKLEDGFVAVFVTETGKHFSAFQHNIGGKKFFIPEPDPVLIYFNNAYLSYRAVEKSKKELIEKLDIELMDENVKNELYTFFGNSFGFATMLFTSIEAYINRSIPKNHIFRDIKSNRTEEYDKNQIERYLSFDVKVKKILNHLKQKNFSLAHPNKNQHIEHLKEFRDSIIHTKANKGKTTPYDYLYKKAFDFKYKETIESVKNWLNFYESNDYIEDCDCGNDW